MTHGSLVTPLYTVYGFSSVVRTFPDIFRTFCNWIVDMVPITAPWSLRTLVSTITFAFVILNIKECGMDGAFARCPVVSLAIFCYTIRAIVAFQYYPSSFLFVNSSNISLVFTECISRFRWNQGLCVPVTRDYLPFVSTQWTWHLFSVHYSIYCRLHFRSLSSSLSGRDFLVQFLHHFHVC